MGRRGSDPLADTAARGAAVRFGRGGTHSHGAGHVRRGVGTGAHRVRLRNAGKAPTRHAGRGEHRILVVSEHLGTADGVLVLDETGDLSKKDQENWHLVGGLPDSAGGLGKRAVRAERWRYVADFRCRFRAAEKRIIIE